MELFFGFGLSSSSLNLSNKLIFFGDSSFLISILISFLTIGVGFGVSTFGLLITFGRSDFESHGCFNNSTAPCLNPGSFLKHFLKKSIQF